MNTPLSKCPADAADIAERYCLDRLAREEKKTFETHLVECTHCCQLVQEHALYIDAMQKAARKLEVPGSG